MTGAWMVNALVVSGFCVTGAALLEWALRERHSSHTRWLWITAMMASASLPFLGPWLSGVMAPLHLPQNLSVSQWIPAVHLGAPSGTIAESEARTGWAGSLWMVLSLARGLTFGATILKLRRQVRGWKPGTVAGVPVRYTEDFGPAVIGIRPARIVLPEWARLMDTRRRRLLLLHEGEHARAGDVALIHAGLALLVLMPWNPLLWWSFRRLRLSLELDCDRRVVLAGASLRPYAEMLLDLPLSRASRPVLTAVAFAPIRSHLGRRIDMITRYRSSLRSPMLPALAGSLAALLFVLACDAAVTDPPAGPDQSLSREARTQQEMERVRAQMLRTPAGTVPATTGDEDGGSVLRKEAVRLMERMTVMVRGGPVSAPSNNSPLLVVDGEIWSGEVERKRMNTLDPALIKSVEVIKGPAAVARFGEGAAHGVILITRRESDRQP